MYQSADAVLTPLLDPGERLLWHGAPRGGIQFRAQDAFLIPFSILWCGFAIFMAVNDVGSNTPIFFKLWGMMFVCIGLFFVFGRFIVDAHNRANTFYGVTNERILIVSGLFSQQAKSLQLRTLSDVSLIQGMDASGTITFGPTHVMYSLFPGGAWPGMGRFAPPSFELIERAKDVYDIIRSAQRAAPANEQSTAPTGNVRT